ncbi:hypothetical protein G6F32_014416 [Rhizopus arrhizus]|nr:hypothetical protein G6F32_014416 [Rhizopus arrhizus]
MRTCCSSHWRCSATVPPGVAGPAGAAPGPAPASPSRTSPDAVTSGCRVRAISAPDPGAWRPPSAACATAGRRTSAPPVWPAPPAMRDGRPGGTTAAATTAARQRSSAHPRTGCGCRTCAGSPPSRQSPRACRYR